MRTATAEGKIKANGTPRGREARLHKVCGGTAHFLDSAATSTKARQRGLCSSADTT
jgi:hypothetical protein